MGKVKKLIKATIIMLLVVCIITPALVIVTGVVALISLENPIQVFRELDSTLGLEGMYKGFIPHIKKVLKGE